MRRVWIGLALALVCFPATMFLWQDGYFASSDGMIHLYRLFELDRSIHAGILYPRWFPLSGYGYGLPVLNFYPPLSYYIAELFHLIGAGYIVSIKLLIAVGFFIAAISMFLFARELLGDRAAFVAGVAYAYLPYLLSDAYVRGNYPEFLAVSLMPLVLFAFRRMYERVDKMNIVGAAFAFAAIVCTHHLTAMLFSVLLVGYVGFLFLMRRDIRALIRCGGAIGLALVLSVFYWLPALSELNLVFVGPSSAARFIVNRLVDPIDFFAPSLAYVYAPQAEALTHTPGFPQTTIALLVGAIGLIMFLIKTRYATHNKHPAPRNTHQVLFFSLVVAVALVMTLNISAPLWYAFSPLRFLQFPWRFHMLAGVGMAFLLGVGAKWLLNWKRFQFLVTSAFSVALILLGVWNLPLRAFLLTDAQVDLTRVSDSDYVVAQMGWSWTREFVPAAVSEFESIYMPIAKPATVNDPVDKLPKTKILDDALFSRTLFVSTAQPFELSSHTFFFPGWQGYIDEEKVTTYPRASLGLATINVPPGDHTISFRFEDTPLRTAVNLVSLFAFVGVMFWLFITQRCIAIASIAALLIVAALFVSQSSVDASPIHPVAIGADFNGQMSLLGYTTERTSDDLQVTLYWLAQQELNRDYTTFVHLQTESGQVIAQHDGFPDQSLTPTTRWIPGEIVVDRHMISLKDVSPGEYNLAAGMYLVTDETFASLGNVELGRTHIR
ncbi:MAG: glycosyltransferase family 39 protein [Chloroflexi bacterium]|nr:glycosyltransferase family 39 protein [Chloroflexota bacterium]